MKQYLLIISIILGVTFACDYRTTRMSNYTVHGIDVSRYQEAINWDTIAKQDIQFAFVKASEGITLNDPLFCYNWEEIRRVGIYRGAYHFFRPAIPARQQAQNFIDWVELEVGDLPPVLDVEVLDGVSKPTLIAGVKSWLFTTELHYGVKPILYTNLKFYNKYLAGHFEDYPLWIARFNTRQPILSTGRAWQFWQYGDRGEVAGIDGDVDLNVFHGSLEQLDSMSLQSPVVLSDVFSD
jgi:lysozyme